MSNKKRLLAVASGGGHWDELMVIRSSFDDFETTFATTNPDVLTSSSTKIRIISDCNQNQPLLVVRCAIDALKLVVALRPQVVVTTGAAPGAISLLVGKIFGARTIWIDGLASANQLSASGKLTRYFADLHLTQWEHLADGRRTQYMGSVL